MLDNLVEVNSFVKPPLTPANVFTLYKELVEVFSTKWTKLNTKEKLTISSYLELNVVYLTRLLKDSNKSLSVIHLFKLCYFFKQDLVLVKGKEKIVFSITDLNTIDHEIIRLNTILVDTIKFISPSYLTYLSKIQYPSLCDFKDVYVTRRNFVRYMRLLVHFDISFYLIPKVKVTQMYKEVKNVA